ncbi:hypothetical protein Y1Q_0002264 [Alligator mississippiensis]|uniref:Uncharacterized protein n=1 Tax=Alligator mississippiensis TaxID=8496 RepID=A0A151MGH0_ALLMI|nr:hypothetical protein Y1Q_0002264 [Alligator mississippiensis]
MVASVCSISNNHYGIVAYAFLKSQKWTVIEEFITKISWLRDYSGKNPDKLVSKIKELKPQQSRTSLLQLCIGTTKSSCGNSCSGSDSRTVYPLSCS